MVKSGKTIPPSHYTKSARIQSRALDDLIDARKVYELFEDGATIVLQALHRYWTPLSHFCRELETALTHPVQVNVYLTPPVSQGLDIHYDTHDVFVLQIAGVKHWKVWHEEFEAPLAHQKRTTTYADPGGATIDVELKPGDSLYIPRGWLHAAETLDRESAHMTVGILSITWIDVLKRVLEGAEDEPEFRRSLPAGFANDPSALHDEIRLAVEGLAAWVRRRDPEDIAANEATRFWSSRPPVLSGQLQQLLSLEDVSDASVVRRRRGAVCVSHVHGDELILTLGDRTLALPAFVASAVETLTGTSSTIVGDLSSVLDEQGRLVLVKRLIREGLLELVPGA